MIEPKVVSITLTRAEGPIGECRKPVVVKSFEEAQTVLSEWGKTAPTEGYDKVDFSIEFFHEAGKQSPYKGRYDMQFGGLESDGSTLLKHIYDWAKYCIKDPHNQLSTTDKGDYRVFLKEIFKEVSVV